MARRYSKVLNESKAQQVIATLHAFNVTPSVCRVDEDGFVVSAELENIVERKDVKDLESNPNEDLNHETVLPEEKAKVQGEEEKEEEVKSEDEKEEIKSEEEVKDLKKEIKAMRKLIAALNDKIEEKIESEDEEKEEEIKSEPTADELMDKEEAIKAAEELMDKGITASVIAYKGKFAVMAADEVEQPKENPEIEVKSEEEKEEEVKSEEKEEEIKK